MSWFRWGLLFSWFLCLSSVHMSAEQPQRHSGFRRLYVLQRGPAGADDGMRVTSISTGQPRAYNADLTANFGSQVRSRRMGNQDASVPQFSQQSVVRLNAPEQSQQRQSTKVSGVNVCGGQCCHGWSQAQGSQRCTKPNCIPRCQNGGMCLRPQLCVCKPGSEGKMCEQKTVHTPPFQELPGNGHTNTHTTGYTNGHNVVPQRPIPQQVLPNHYASTSPSSSNIAQMKLTVRSATQDVQPHYIQQHIHQQIHSMPMQSAQSQQYVKKPIYSHTGTTHTQTQPRLSSLKVGHNSIHAVGNHTGRIKVVFTPTICKLICMGSRCHNNCKLGNTTTIISENGHAADTLTAPNFRVVVCHLPCINGGKCSNGDRCQCPPRFTGKFCQIPVKNGHQQHQQTSGGYSQTQIHSVQTVPLTYSNSQSAVFNPSSVNIHIKHPPEASVQVHQVSWLDNHPNSRNQLKGYQSGSSSSTSYSVHHTESRQQIQHHGYNIVHPSQHSYQVSQYQPVTSKNMLGRCFQETAGNQCGKALPGLTKQEQCCGTVGTSWGFHKCQKCPKTPSIPLIDCPQGYKRINSSHCQDLDECQLHGVCQNGNCLNTIGSYKCMCKPDYVPVPTLTGCISVTPAIQEEKGACFRLVSSGRQCLHPVSTQLSKQLCCCSVGKAWGPQCDKCPPPGTVKFKEICPGGMGYTVLPNPPVNKPVTINQESIELLPPQPLPTPERPVEAFGEPEIQPEVVERSPPPEPVEILPSNAGQDIAPTQSAEVNECQINPHICGEGICYNTAESYSCHCDEGYQLDETQTTCVDVNECTEEASPCPAVGECVNNRGSYTCTCPKGYLQINGTSCRDVDECVDVPDLCSPHGKCLNTEGSFMCVCESGFTANPDTPYCDDIDECGLNETLCGPHGFCENNLGSFRCLCDQGYQESLDDKRCVASSVERKECYYHLNSENLCESVLTSHVTLQECCCTLGAGWGDNCEVHPCPVNGTDQFNQMCPSGKGFLPNGDLLYGLPTAENYRDADECALFGEEVCKGGFCLDTVGSYECYCKAGQDYDPVKLECRDINECLDESVCVDGECLNTDGSYMCFCTHPMVLDANSNQCVFDPEVAEEHEATNMDYQGICWQTVTESLTCTLPLAPNRKTTYTECCCLYGEAWGMECALCPPKNTADYASMCNLPIDDSVTYGDQRPYGRDALVVSPDYSTSSEQQAALPFYENEEHPFREFQGLRAEECGILSGCENGRCVRVQEGFSCDCFDGYRLDLSHMSCIDVNECSELNNRMLCKNAKCINTVGSFQCECLPGFTASDNPNHCVKAATHQTLPHTQ